MVSVQTLREEKVMSFKSDLKPYNAVGKFKFWCQKVLPTVYDNSLSYYEVLNKLVKYLNDLIENVDTIEDNLDTVNQSVERVAENVGTIEDNLDTVSNSVETLDERTELLEVQDVLQANGTYILTGIAEHIGEPGENYGIGWELVPSENLTNGEYILALDVNGNAHTKEWKAKELVKYSSNEIVIGTWINGKSLYQKTIRLGTPPTDVESSLPHGISSMLQCVDIKGYAVVGSYYHPIAQVGPIYVDTTNIHFAPLQSINDSYVTIQYTKTTD